MLRLLSSSHFSTSQRIAVLAIGVALLTPAARADYYAQVGANIEFVQYYGPHGFDGVRDPVSVDEFRQWGLPSYGVTAEGRGSRKTLQLTGNSFATLNPDVNRAIAGVSVGWLDEWTISDPRLNGTIGTVNFTIDLQGELDANILADTDVASSTFSIAPNGDDWSDRYKAIATPGDIFARTLVGGPLMGTATFTYGVKTPFNFKLGASAASQDSGHFLPGDAGASFSVTASWNGFSGVFDAAGNPVHDYTFSSASGENWATAAPVPEPPSLTIFCVGLFGLRKRRAAVGRSTRSR